MKKTIIILSSILAILLISLILIIPNQKKDFAIEPTPTSEESTPTPKPSATPTPTATPTSNPTETKLASLNYINKKINFFNMNYLDRYVSYKKQNPKVSDEMVVVYVNIGLDQTNYTNIKNTPNASSTNVLVNKYWTLGSNFVPAELEQVGAAYSWGNQYLTKVARIAFEKMAADIFAQGYTLYASSTYRSYSTQNGLYWNYVNNYGQAEADTFSARPGHSEHQTGLAVDVRTASTIYTSFGNTNEYIWMKNNAYKYGFIQRYTDETRWITGYVTEEWHYRYVGVEIATYIQNNKMTYDEYYVRFIENKK